MSKVCEIIIPKFNIQIIILGIIYNVLRIHVCRTLLKGFYIH